MTLRSWPDIDNQLFDGLNKCTESGCFDQTMNELMNNYTDSLPWHLTEKGTCSKCQHKARTVCLNVVPAAINYAKDSTNALLRITSDWNCNESSGIWLQTFIDWWPELKINVAGSYNKLIDGLNKCIESGCLFDQIMHELMNKLIYYHCIWLKKEHVQSVNKQRALSVWMQHCNTQRITQMQHYR